MPHRTAVQPTTLGWNNQWSNNASKEKLSDVAGGQKNTMVESSTLVNPTLLPSRRRQLSHTCLQSRRIVGTIVEVTED